MLQKAYFCPSNCGIPFLYELILSMIYLSVVKLISKGACSDSNLVSELSKKQSSVSLSTTEAEYIAVVACCTQVLWMKQTLTDIQVEYDEPIPIYCDNTSAISISKNPVMHSKTKHIPIKYHFLQEQVAEKNIRVEYVGRKEQVADIFTKPLPREAFEYLRQRLGVISTPKMNVF
jgi:hypothetical protein